MSDAYKIEDKRKSGYYKVDTVFIRGGWAKEFGVYGIAVYNVLCCSADNTTKDSYPKYQTIANQIGCSRRQVIRAIDDLETARLIKIRRRKRRDGTQTSNLIELLDQNEWLSPSVIRQKHEIEKIKRRRKKQPGDSESPGQSDSESPGQSDSESLHELDSLDSLTKPTLGGANASPPSSDFNSASKPQNQDETSKHPAIQVFKEEMGRYPRKNQYRDIAKAVGEGEADLEFWRKVVKGWKLTPWAQTNVGGMLDYYRRREIPSTNPNAGGKSNGRITKNQSGATGATPKGDQAGTKASGPTDPELLAAKLRRKNRVKDVGL